MRSIRSLLPVAAFAAPFVLAGPAFAHPRLLSATPAANATASNVTRISLAFSEKLIAKLSGVDLAMTGMAPDAQHEPMAIKGFKTALGPDGKTLTATFPHALSAGTYKLDWHVVSVDTHRVTGSINFIVR